MGGAFSWSSIHHGSAAERITSSVVLRPSLTAVKKAVREGLATVDIHVLCLVSDLEYLPRVIKTRTFCEI